MSKIVKNITTLDQLYQDFEKSFSTFQKDTISKITDGFLKNCEDELSGVMLKKLHLKISAILNAYQQILSWWKEYNDSSHNVEKAIMQQAYAFSNSDLFHFADKRLILPSFFQMELEELLKSSLVQYSNQNSQNSLQKNPSFQTTVPLENPEVNIDSSTLFSDFSFTMPEIELLNHFLENFSCSFSISQIEEILNQISFMDGVSFGEFSSSLLEQNEIDFSFLKSDFPNLSFPVGKSISIAGILAYAGLNGFQNTPFIGDLSSLTMGTSLSSLSPLGNIPQMNMGTVKTPQISGISSSFSLDSISPNVSSQFMSPITSSHLSISSLSLVNHIQSFQKPSLNSLGMVTPMMLKNEILEGKPILMNHLEQYAQVHLGSIESKISTVVAPDLKKDISSVFLPGFLASMLLLGLGASILKKEKEEKNE